MDLLKFGKEDMQKLHDNPIKVYEGWDEEAKPFTQVVAFAMELKLYAGTDHRCLQFASSRLASENPSSRRLSPFESIIGGKRGQLLTMTIYMSRLFRKSNSSFLLSSGKALKSEVSRFRDDMLLVDAGIGTPKITMPEELRGIPSNRDVRKFENKVGFMEATAGESLVKTQILERMFMDLVAGEPDMKERAIARFNDSVGSTNAVAGEPAILLSRRFTQDQAWMELKKMRQSHKKVKGFPMEKLRGGYSVAIAEFGKSQNLVFASFLI
ncbi:hypothetical protein R6Q57_008408 [Mikania cordata]